MRETSVHVGRVGVVGGDGVELLITIVYKR